jgi:surfeit locus 1 family protein
MAVGGRSWLAAIVVSAALAAAFVALGRWQWQRAAEARELNAAFAAAVSLAPLDRPPDDADIAGLRYRTVELFGRYEPQRQLLLDNRVRDGRVGYEVLTPFRRSDREPWLLVNRGWIAADPDRKRLPAVGVGAHERPLKGRIDTLPRVGLDLPVPQDDGAASGLRVVSYPSAAEIAAALGHATFGYQILLDPGEPDGFARDWRAPGPAPERHLAYAGQWLLLAATAIVIGGVTAVRLRRHRR